MKILVIRLKQIGDALLSLPVCSSLKKTYPEARVDYLVYEHIAPLLTNQPGVDRVLTISPEERDQPLKYLQRIWQIRRERYDMVIDLITVPTSAIMTFLSGAGRRIGFDHRRTRSFLYRTRVPHPSSGGTVEAKLSILRALGDEVQYERRFEIYLTEAEIEAMRGRLSKAGVDLNKMLVFAAVTSRRDYKFWPPEYFAAVLDWFRNKYGAELIFNSVPGVEQDFVDRVVSLLGDTAGCYADIRCGLRELAVLIKVCDFTIANDGGPNHMSIAVGTPSLAVFSPVNSKRSWIPEGNERHQGIDLTDVLDLSLEQHRARLPEFRSELDKYYRMITPQLVIERAQAMIDNLSRKKLLRQAG